MDDVLERNSAPRCAVKRASAAPKTLPVPGALARPAGAAVRTRTAVAVRRAAHRGPPEADFCAETGALDRRGALPRPAWLSCAARGARDGERARVGQRHRGPLSSELCARRYIHSAEARQSRAMAASALRRLRRRRPRRSVCGTTHTTPQGQCAVLWITRGEPQHRSNEDAACCAAPRHARRPATRRRRRVPTRTSTSPGRHAAGAAAATGAGPLQDFPFISPHMPAAKRCKSGARRCARSTCFSSAAGGPWAQQGALPPAQGVRWRGKQDKQRLL